MKKDKKLKLSYSNDQAIIQFKNAIANQSTYFRFGTFTGYEQEHNKEKYVLRALFDCGDYKLKIIYKAGWVVVENIVDCVFEINNQEFMIYDIFNLFDINDFNQYYYQNCVTENDINSAVSKIFNLVEKYDYDLKKAAQDEYSELLCENVKNDYNAVYDKSDAEDGNDDDDDDEILGFLLTHPYYSHACGAVDTQKLLKKLEKAERKNKIDTLYEKRLLAYLRNGNSYIDENAVNDKKRDKGVWRYEVLTALICFVFALITSVLLVVAVSTVNYSGAYFDGSLFQIPLLKLGLTIEHIVGIGWGSIMFASFYKILFGKKIVGALSGNNADFVELYNKNNDQYSKKKKKKSKIPAAVFSIVLGLIGCLFVAVESFGFYDDGVKFVPFNSFVPVYVSNENLEIYTVEKTTDDDGYTVDAVNAYAVTDGGNIVYEFGEIEKGGETEKRLLNIADEYNKEIKSVEWVDDLLPDYEEIDEEFEQ